MSELPLGRDFPPVSEADWRALVTQALKGGTSEKLVSRSYDGIDIAPLHAPATDAMPVLGGTPGKAWEVAQRIDLADAEAANAQALDDLAQGATALALVFKDAVGDYGAALAPTKEAVARALDGVFLDAGIDLDLGAASRDAALRVAELVRQRGTDPAKTKIRFGLDPLGAQAADGGVPAPWTETAPIFARLVGGLADQGFSGPFAVADGRPVHAAGGSEAQELAFTLAAAVAYLRALEAGGVPLDKACNMLYFRLAADQEQFLTIAKFRALRKLWARVEQACGLTPKPAFVMAETAWRMLTKRDPYTNILRGTIAALAAGVGGADAVTVLPYTAPLGVPEPHARRVARNTQLILIEEANLHRVAEPAAGSGTIEYLTGALCARAWDLFQQIEAEGGLAQALSSGSVQNAIARTREARRQALAQRKEGLVGTSEFPYLEEEPASVAEPYAKTGALSDSALPRIRLAEPFEALRDLSDNYLKTHGTRPRLLLANLGRPSDFNARAGFTKSFFESGGIETIENIGFANAAELAAFFKTADAPLACLCSSDKVYAELAEEAAEALQAAGAKHLYLAGKPGEDRERLEQAGIGTFVHQGCDSLEVLAGVYEILT
jgi:methylmalonyl-CoA mutase